MKALARCLLLFVLIAVAAGCADMRSSSSSSSTASSEPVATPPSSDVYFDLFSDVPIPRDMSVDRKRTLVSTAQNGLNIGLLTVSGRVELRSLNEVMVQNMMRNGWSLRAATTGVKTMQIFEKGIQYAVVYTFEEMFTTIMEIWGAQRLSDGLVPAPGAGSSLFQLEPTPVHPNTTQAK